MTAAMNEQELQDHITEMVKDLTNKLYGPKFCIHCNKEQPVLTYQLERSDFVKQEGTMLTFGFMGSQVCSVCFKTIGDIVV